MAAWYEFLCGPVTGAQVAAIRGFLREIVVFGEAQAMEAARLATNNQTDFKAFASHGLALV